LILVLLLVFLAPVLAENARSPLIRLPEKEDIDAHLMAYHQRGNPDRQREVLDGFLTRVRELNLAPNTIEEGKSRRKIVLFDLDNTLFDVDFKNLVILFEYCVNLPQVERACTQKPEQPDCALLPQKKDFCGRAAPLQLRHIGYSLTETLTNLKLSLDPRSALFLDLDQHCNFWFFQGKYCEYDRPYLGAAEFVSELHDKAGATVVYLTGRRKVFFFHATKQALDHGGFPVPAIDFEEFDPHALAMPEMKNKFREQRVFLIMKGEAETGDHKLTNPMLERIQAEGEIVGGFENEPEIASTWANTYPDGQFFLIKTKARHPNAELDARVHLIHSYLR